jgi:Flp pilus assembly protein TadD
MFQYAVVNTETKVAESLPDRRPRYFAGAAIAIAVLVPVVLLAMKRGDKVEPPPAGVPAVAAPTFDQEVELSAQLLKVGKAQESLAPLERAQRLNPNAFAVHTNLCMAYVALDRKDDAVAACRRATEVDPASNLGKNNLAWVQSLKVAPKP